MSVFRTVKRFVRDDAGNAAISDVAILAVGAIVLIAVLALWNDTIKPNVEGKMDVILGGGTASK